MIIASVCMVPNLFMCLTASLTFSTTFAEIFEDKYSFDQFLLLAKFDLPSNNFFTVLSP